MGTDNIELQSSAASGTQSGRSPGGGAAPHPLAFWSAEHEREAARQLGLSGDHIIVYMASELAFLYDTAEVLDHLDDLDSLHSVHEVRAAVDAATRSVPLPTGFRLVGMRPRDSAPESARTYGLVDFSAMGAK